MIAILSDSEGARIPSGDTWGTFRPAAFWFPTSIPTKALHVRDANGDHDELDLGEVVTFADGIEEPAATVAFQSTLLCDYNRNDEVDAADNFVWRIGSGTTLTPADCDVLAGPLRRDGIQWQRLGGGQQALWHPSQNRLR